MDPVILKLIGTEFKDYQVSLLCYHFTTRNVESSYGEIQKPDF